jgi:hypothetical protein
MRLLTPLSARWSPGTAPHGRLARPTAHSELSYIPRCRTPGGPIPKQEDTNIRQRRQKNVFEVLGTGFSGENSGSGDQFLTGVQVQRAIETHFGSSKIHPNHGGVPDGRPHVHRGGLQVHPGFVLRQDRGFGRALSDVDQFFSTWASNSAT